MFTIYGENYKNDYTRKNFTMTFSSLEEIFEYMKRISKNFSYKNGTYFPTKGNYSGYNWCRRITTKNEDSNMREFWIYQINNDNGIVYSNGHYTQGDPFCAKSIQNWLIDCKNRVDNAKPNFVEF